MSGRNIITTKTVTTKVGGITTVKTTTIETSCDLDRDHDRDSFVVVARNSLYPGEALENGQKLTSHSGQFAMVMQSDGNLVLYSGGNPIWSSRTYGKGLSPYRLVMQEDSNLRIYDVSGRCTWTSGTPRAGKPGALATMQGRIKSCEDYMKIRIMSLMGTLHMTSSVLILVILPLATGCFLLLCQC